MNYYRPKNKKLYGPPDLAGMGFNPEDKNILAAAGFFPVRYEIPDYDQVTQYLKFPTEIPLDEVTNEYVVTYVVKDITDPEILRLNREQQTAERFRDLRAKRDKRLGETDYMAFADYPLTEEQRRALNEYRQALRDLPSLEGAPWDGGDYQTPWPEMPMILRKPLPQEEPVEEPAEEPTEYTVQ